MTPPTRLKSRVQKLPTGRGGDFTRGKIEVRNDDDGQIDEVIAADCMVHLERMSDGEWSLLIYAKRETGCYWIGSKRGKAHVTTTESWKDKPLKKR